MKNVTESFKENLKKHGKQLDAIITTDDFSLTAEDINEIIISENGNLFKTVMYALELDSNIEIPKDTSLDFKIGVKFDNDYEYINFYNYIVNECESQEDTLSYKIIAYDRMVESMVDYDLELYEEITVRAYLIKICERLGWDTTNIPATFINSNKLVNPSLHIGVQYTFRDALDEIATITCSFLHFIDDNFCLSYITETNEIIDEESLSETDVTIGDKYYINSLVFSRAEESDNIYRKDDEDIEQNGLHEFQISDNQLLSTNDRDLYIDEMYEYLRALEFYLYDMKSTGLLIFDVADRFTVNVHEKTYSTFLLNNEINITQGLNERLYIDEPDETTTDYKYADTTDKKINQTYILVDKQNQVISQVVSQQTDYEDKLSQITQDVDSIKQEVSNNVNCVRTVDGVTEITLEDCIEGYLLGLTIYGNNIVFEHLYPRDEVYPDDDLYPFGDSIIVVTDENGNSTQYDLGVLDVLRQNDETYDQLDFEKGTITVTRRIDEDGNTLEEEQIEELESFDILIPEGNVTITILSYNAKIHARYAIKTDYSDIFATQIDLSSSITQTAEAITLSVSEKLTEYDTSTEVSSKIEQTANSITSTVSSTYATKNELSTAQSEIKQTTDSITSTVSKKVGEDEIISKINQSAETVGISADKIELSANDVLNLLAGNTINLTSKNIAISSDAFSVTKAGKLSCSNVNITGGVVNLSPSDSVANPYVKVKSEALYSGGTAYIQGGYISCQSSSSTSYMSPDEIYAPQVSQSSLEGQKKNFEKLEDALQILKEVDIYKYNLKTQEDDEKKHIGFVIGENYNYAHEITSVDKENKENGVDLYSMTSVLWKAVQEQQETIETLQDKIKELKGE